MNLYSSARKAHIDGADMRAGDGIFINSSCSPNVMLHPCLVFHDESVLVPDTNGRVTPKIMRKIITVYRLPV